MDKSKKEQTLNGERSYGRTAKMDKSKKEQTLNGLTAEHQKWISLIVQG